MLPEDLFSVFIITGTYKYPILSEERGALSYTSTDNYV